MRGSCKNKGRQWIPAIAIFALAATACGSAENPVIVPDPSQSVKSEEHINVGGADVIVKGRTSIQTSSVSLEVDDDYFKPNILSGSPGTTVTANLKSEGQRKHNFSLAEQGIDQDIVPGASTSVSFTFPQSGTLVFFCKYHRESSAMLGELEAL
ncbi:MAG: cupredoxin domain-containing protein [Actinomycetota bacterium]